jgi:phosphatidylinositol glycan class K
MYQKKRYNEIFFMIDTCQANTMYSKLYSPNILATGSSGLGENSYSHANDNDIGVAVIDAFTHYVLEFMEKINKTSQVSMQELLSSVDVTKINSHPGVRSDLFKRPLDKTQITDFFGGVAQVEIAPPLDIATTTISDVATSATKSNSDSTVNKGKGKDDILQLRPDTPLGSTHKEPSTAPSISVKLMNWMGEKERKTARAWASVTLVGILASWVASKW